MIRGEKPTWSIYLILCECPQEASQGVRGRVGQGRKCAEGRLYESWGHGGEGQQSSLVQERQGEEAGEGVVGEQVAEIRERREQCRVHWAEKGPQRIRGW